MPRNSTDSYIDNLQMVLALGDFQTFFEYFGCGIVFQIVTDSKTDEIVDNPLKSASLFIVRCADWKISKTVPGGKMKFDGVLIVVEVQIVKTFGETSNGATTIFRIDPTLNHSLFDFSGKGKHKNFGSNTLIEVSHVGLSVWRSLG
jgi:hypothetical protein